MAESDVDRFIKESCKSYRECNIKNTARRNSLQKKTMGIESERRIASAKHSREERQLRQQLKQMNIEKAKNDIIHHLREPTRKSSSKGTSFGDHVMPTEPYPITFRTNCQSSISIDKHFEANGLKHRIQQRRQSKEFEDLALDTDSGALSQAASENSETIMRPRVHSMSQILRGKLRISSGSDSPPTSPRLHHKILALKSGKGTKGGHSSSSSRESLSSSAERLKSLEELCWVGEPEAINSVRRPRKTIEEQELDAELQKLSVS